MKILSGDEISNVVARTLERGQVDGAELRRRTAAAVTAEVKALCRPADKLLVLAGWGNNGADALQSAAFLAEEGYRPEVFLFNIGGSRINGESRRLVEVLESMPSVTLHEITGSEPFHWTDPDASTTVVDGLFGSGLNSTLPRTFQLLAKNINESGATVVSIDLPSGLMAEWNGNASREDMIHATVTVSIEVPKLSFMFGDNASAVGRWKTARIGLDAQALREAPFTFVYVDRQTVAHELHSRDAFASKADFGNAILYCGSQGMMGAAVLSAVGALRAGAGKLTVHSASDGNCIVQTAVPCAMFRNDPDRRRITDMVFDNRYTAVGVGCGIGTADDTANAFERLAKATAAAGKRMVIDADALNILAKRPIILNFLPALSVLTPHKKEFDRIFGESPNDEERLKRAIKAAEEYNLIIVLKGRYTAIVRPDGKVMFNSSGTPAMATPGSGDVLTGIITGLMATGLKSELAAFVGVYVHGVAGEISEAEHGEYGVTAIDIANNTGKAIKQIMNRENK